MRIWTRHESAQVVTGQVLLVRIHLITGSGNRSYELPRTFRSVFPTRILGSRITRHVWELLGQGHRYEYANPRPGLDPDGGLHGMENARCRRGNSRCQWERRAQPWLSNSRVAVYRIRVMRCTVVKLSASSRHKYRPLGRLDPSKVISYDPAG